MKTKTTETADIGTGLALLALGMTLIIGIPLINIILCLVAIILGAMGNQNHEKGVKACLTIAIITLILNIAWWIWSYYQLMAEIEALFS